MTDNVVARHAATVMLIRDGQSGLEVLMVVRRAHGFFGGLTAFPGGAVDPVDRSQLAAAVTGCSGPDREVRNAALRELAEETGFALTAHGVVPAPPGQGEQLLASLQEAGIHLDGDGLTFVSRWVTPEAAPTRFDARFFLAGVIETPEVRLATGELVDHMWVAPPSALEMESAGMAAMFLPTLAHLRWLSQWQEIESALAAAEGADGRSLIQPRRMEDGSLVPVPLPEQP